MLTLAFELCTSKCRMFLPSICFEFWDVGWVIEGPHTYQHWGFIILMCIQDTVVMWRTWNRCIWCPASIPFTYPCFLATALDSFQSMVNFTPQHLLLFFSAQGLSRHPEESAKPSAQKCRDVSIPGVGGHSQPIRDGSQWANVWVFPVEWFRAGLTLFCMTWLGWPWEWVLPLILHPGYLILSTVVLTDSEVSSSPFLRGFPAGLSPSSWQLLAYLFTYFPDISSPVLVSFPLFSHWCILGLPFKYRTHFLLSFDIWRNLNLRQALLRNDVFSPSPTHQWFI